MDTMRFNEKRVQDRYIDEVFGMCQGILADDEVNEAEKEKLIEKIRLFRLELHTLINPLYQELINKNNTLNDIKLHIKNFIGTEFGETSIIQIEPDNIENLDFTDKHFCLTGTFCNSKKNDRSYMYELIKNYGGIIDKNLTLKTDYLVIGECGGTRDWLHTNSGNKIIKALEIRKKKQSNLKIISESQLLSFM